MIWFLFIEIMFFSNKYTYYLVGSMHTYSLSVRDDFLRQNAQRQNMMATKAIKPNDYCTTAHNSS